MNSELKAKWVAALRSGRYKQGDGLLRSRNDEYCCLGVLCDVYDPSRWGDKPDYSGYTWDDHDHSKTTLPPSMRDAIGHIVIDHLMKMNDVYDDTFDKIATYIEINL